MEIERMFLILMHVLCVMGAAVGIALADLSLFKEPHVDSRLLRMASRLVLVMLGLLWISGLCIIWVDTGFDLSLLGSKPKLVAKIGLAVVLSLNGALLHQYFFQSLTRPPRNVQVATNVATLLAAVSGASWPYAVFLGLAKPLTPMLGLGGFIGLFAALLGVAIVLVTIFVKPRFYRMYSRRQTDAIWGAN